MKALSLFLLIIIFLVPACSSATPMSQPPTASPEEPTSSEPSGVTPEATAEPAEPISPAGDTTSLVGTQWTLESFGAPGAETPVVAGSTVTLQFQAEGQAGGSGGCNSYGGQYEIEDSTLSFSQVMSTLMACADESITQQEQQYFQALETAGRFEVAGDQLTIWYNNEQAVLNFARVTP